MELPLTPAKGQEEGVSSSSNCTNIVIPMNQANPHLRGLLTAAKLRGAAYNGSVEEFTIAGNHVTSLRASQTPQRCLVRSNIWEIVMQSPSDSQMRVVKKTCF